MKTSTSILVICFAFFFSCKTNSHIPADKNTSKLSDEALLTLIQKQTFQYFWDGAEPTSGMARERIHIDGVYPENDQNVITIGGSGFGLMGLLVGIERQFIPKQEGENRIAKILDYLKKADRFHGAWSHWYEGPTGKVKSFSKQDDGADVVETAFMAQALICVREYYKNGTASQQNMAKQADMLWKDIDWNFFRNEKDVLYWHWSPTYGWGMNHAIQGYDECLITYILAASSPTFAIPADTYHKGWARSGAIVSKETKFGIPLVLKHNASPNAVGPLFWEHYSYLGLNPKGLKDQYAHYWDVVSNHTKINIAYANQNPKNYVGYGGDKGWGLTASYSIKGYDAHHPDNDHGVISPTAALSSIAYTPKESLAFAHYLYEHLGSKTWGKYGFYDAYSETANWYPQRYLAIDQGPILVMIENYRSGLMWKLFMGAPDVQQGLNKLGFTTE
ncbi:beta-glucosidase [Sphingobacterium sp. SRCM116780]|uniref:glucoamylase family protein n=1 Tax=Sphingobacterium sp. SRCM116780 TaxID=2907623 RepID=UPI001F2E32DA|nr:glucoamylase family protein [Sphingobacterium sp. SRCM116780]UIR54691.1 beta-glucosidase [Sphingobacterium sp. SRCM116780]